MASSVSAVAEQGQSPLAPLLALARGASAHALPLPARQATVEPWRGLGFNVGGNRLVSALGQVLEVLAPPRLTPIPGVKPWIMGVANVRGRLLPVVDLCSYLGLDNTAGRAQWRVLVVEDGELYCGLMVEQSFGMLQFEPQEAVMDSDDDVEAGLAPYLRGSYRQSARQWRVMDVRALVREPGFFDVGAA